MFLPSLLEYTSENLKYKLELLNKRPGLYRKLSQNPKLQTFDLHLDFVLPQFAKDRSVMKSLSPEIVFQILNSIYPNFDLNLSVHLMGTTQDLFDVYNFFEHYKFNPNWKYLVFIPEKFTFSWENSDFKELNENLKVGIWYDLGDWENKTFGNADNFLLMTVLAGKSGQKLNSQVAAKVIETCDNYSNKNFILDGGWSINANHQSKNTQIVSHSSFWSKYTESILAPNSL